MKRITSLVLVVLLLCIQVPCLAWTDLPDEFIKSTNLSAISWHRSNERLATFAICCMADYMMVDPDVFSKWNPKTSPVYFYLTSDNVLVMFTEIKDEIACLEFCYPNERGKLGMDTSPLSASVFASMIGADQLDNYWLEYVWDAIMSNY